MRGFHKVIHALVITCHKFNFTQTIILMSINGVIIDLQKHLICGKTNPQKVDKNFARFLKIIYQPPTNQSGLINLKNGEMKNHEIIIGEKYLFVNNGNILHKKEFHNKEAIVLKRIKGKVNKTAFHRNQRGKKPDKYWLDIGCYANASNLKQLTPPTHETNTIHHS